MLFQDLSRGDKNKLKYFCKYIAKLRIANNILVMVSKNYEEFNKTTARVTRLVCPDSLPAELINRMHVTRNHLDSFDVK